MKTAMQELTDILENYKMSDITDEQKSIFSSIIYQIDIIFLEKEKEQIIEAGNVCSIKTIVHKEKLDEMSENELRDSLVEDTISYGEEYYNQTYNQNK